MPKLSFFSATARAERRAKARADANALWDYMVASEARYRSGVVL